jgi:hypothetical protein
VEEKTEMGPWILQDKMSLEPEVKSHKIFKLKNQKSKKAKDRSISEQLLTKL